MLEWHGSYVPTTESRQAEQRSGLRKWVVSSERHAQKGFHKADVDWRWRLIRQECCDVNTQGTARANASYLSVIDH